jgi:hypothetical protein
LPTRKYEYCFAEKAGVIMHSRNRRAEMVFMCPPKREKSYIRGTVAHNDIEQSRIPPLPSGPSKTALQ